MKLKLTVAHPNEHYIWDVLQRVINNLPKDARVTMSLELKGEGQPGN